MYCHKSPRRQLRNQVVSEHPIPLIIMLLSFTDDILTNNKQPSLNPSLPPSSSTALDLKIYSTGWHNPSFP